MNPSPRFSTSEAAEATGLDPKLLDSWLVRGAFALSPIDTQARGHGSARGWTVRTVRKLALTSTLRNAGITASLACSAAERCISKCDFLSDETYNYAAFQPAGAVQIVSLDRSRNFQDTMTDLIGGGTSVVLVDLTRLFARTQEKLMAIAQFTEQPNEI